MATKDKFRAAVEKIRTGDGENAFFELIELKGEVLPAIIEAFRGEAQPDARAVLVKAAWERREDAVIPFLAEAPCDRSEEVWQQALDGLVAFAGVSTLEILTGMRSREFADGESSNRFRFWLEETIQQVPFEVQSRA